MHEHISGDNLHYAGTVCRNIVSRILLFFFVFVVVLRLVVDVSTTIRTALRVTTPRPHLWSGSLLQTMVVVRRLAVGYHDRKVPDLRSAKLGSNQGASNAGGSVDVGSDQCLLVTDLEFLPGVLFFQYEVNSQTI